MCIYIYEEKIQKENQNTISAQRGRHAYAGTGAAQWRGSYLEGSCMLCLVTSDGGIQSCKHTRHKSRTAQPAPPLNEREDCIRSCFWAHCQSVRRYSSTGASEGVKAVAKKRCNVQLSFVEHEPTNMVTVKSWGPIQKCNFWWGSNLHSVDLSQKEPYQAQCSGETYCARVPSEHLVIFRLESQNIWTKKC